MQINLIRVDLVVVGALSADYARITDDYERRLGRYVKFVVHEIKAEPVQRGEQLVLSAEFERINTVLKRLSAKSKPDLVVLDSRGDTPTTEVLAKRWLSASHLVVVIGGSMGVAKELRDQASALISFGRITLPHQLARVVVTEQIYRCWRIARGEPYHY